MAITSYSTLKIAVASWIGRADLTDNIPDFITFFEAHVNRRLRVRQMETVTTISTTSGSRNLPDDFLSQRRLTWNGDIRRSLEYITPDSMQVYHPSDDEGTPTVYTIEGGLIKVRPIDDDTDYTLTYYAALDPLDSDADTNWLLGSYPDAYLFGALVEANAFVQNPEHASLWAQRRDLVLNQLETLSMKSKAPSAIRVAGPTP